MKSLAVDLRFNSPGGIGTYITNLLPRVLEEADLGRIVALTSSSNQVPDTLSSSGVDLLEYRVAPPFSVREHIQVPRLLQRLGVGAAWFPHMNLPFAKPAPFVIATVHDLLYIDANGLGGGAIKRSAARFYLSNVVRNADRIVTVSEFSRDRLIHRYPAVGERVRVIKHGTDHVHDEVGSSESLGVMETPYFLYVGNLKRHKGVGTLLDAAEALWADGATDFRLVIAGTRLDQRDIDRTALARASRHRGTVLLGSVTQAHLTTLLLNAVCLIQPSMYEGYGLPASEAASLGTPTILSDIPALREAGGPEAHYFAVGNVSELAALMRHVLETRGPRGARSTTLRRTWRDAASEFADELVGVS